MYRAALRLRREYDLGINQLTWVDAAPDVLAFRSGEVLVLTNFGATPADLPPGVTVLLSSEPLTDDGRVPQDVTVWAR
jgi:alpha-glucosidase